MFAGMFSKCPNCGKLEMPPGVTVIAYSMNAPQLFCDGDGACTRVPCMGCGHIVNPMFHSYEECGKLRRLCDLRACHDEALRFEDVLEEAEMILNGGGHD